MPTMNKIALAPAMEKYRAPAVIHERLVDFGDARREAMDRAAIERCVLSLPCPGVPEEPNREYPDDPKFDPFWERAEELGTPARPADPLPGYPAMAGRAALQRAIGEWGGDGLACAAPDLRGSFRSFSGNHAGVGALERVQHE